MFLFCSCGVCVVGGGVGHSTGIDFTSYYLTIVNIYTLCYSFKYSAFTERLLKQHNTWFVTLNFNQDLYRIFNFIILAGEENSKIIYFKIKRKFQFEFIAKTIAFPKLIVNKISKFIYVILKNLLMLSSNAFWSVKYMDY